MLSHFSCVQLFATPTVARQAPLSMEFSRQEYWSGLLHPPSRDLPGPGIEPVSVMSPALAAGSLPLAPLGKPSAYYKDAQILPHLLKSGPWVFAGAQPGTGS